MAAILLNVVEVAPIGTVAVAKIGPTKEGYYPRLRGSGLFVVHNWIAGQGPRPGASIDPPVAVPVSGTKDWCEELLVRYKREGIEALARFVWSELENEDLTVVWARNKEQASEFSRRVLLKHPKIWKPAREHKAPKRRTRKRQPKVEEKYKIPNIRREWIEPRPLAELQASADEYLASRREERAFAIERTVYNLDARRRPLNFDSKASCVGILEAIEAEELEELGLEHEPEERELVYGRTRDYLKRR